jgi:hypothetical protein
MDDDIILSHGSERGTKVLYAVLYADDAYVYEVKGKTLTAKYNLSHTDLIAAIDQWILANS